MIQVIKETFNIKNNNSNIFKNKFLIYKTKYLFSIIYITLIPFSIFT